MPSIPATSQAPVGCHQSQSHHKSLWELACQRFGQHNQNLHCLTLRHRWQASSHRFVGCRQSQAHQKSLWELACQRFGQHSQHLHYLTHPHRQQGWLPQFLWTAINPNHTPKQMWERACSRKRQISQHQSRLTHRLREQARSHKSCSNHPPKNPPKPPVARELAPAGSRSGPDFPTKSKGLLRSPAGASSLATSYLANLLPI